MGIPEFVKSVLEPWSSFYQGSKVLISLARFTHLAGVLIGGGAAVAADRGSIQALREGPGFRGHHLTVLRRVHRVITGGLVLMGVSGLMMLAADLKTFVRLWTFWIKMLLVAVLLVNGFAITRIERTLRPDSPSGWAALGVTSRISFFLWIAVVLASAVLVLVA